MNRLLDKLDRKIGRFAIPNLMMYIVGGMLVVFLMDIFMEPQLGFTLSEKMAFDREAILSGEIWRLISFILIPINSNPFFIILSLYFSWLIGSGLEAEWGTFKFNVYYLIGILLTIASGFITGFATNSYLHLTMFLAFAVIYPEFELRIFFVLPVKIKILAVIDAVSMLLMLIVLPWEQKLALIIAIGNFLLFFIPDLIDGIKAFNRRRKYRKEMKDYWKN